MMLCLMYRPDLIDFDKLKKSNAHHNLQNAFNLAEQHLGLTKLLDPEGEFWTMLFYVVEECIWKIAQSDATHDFSVYCD